MMKAIDVERIVREVLTEMGVSLTARTLAPAPVAAAAIPPQPSQCSAKKPEPQPAPAAATPGDLTLDSRLITMEDVAGRLGGIRRLLVPRGALVTPAVRDELLRRGISLEQLKPNGVKQAAAKRVVLVTLGNRFDPAMLMANMKREGLVPEHTTLDCLMAASDLLAAELTKPDTLGLLLTRHTAAAICLANRLRGVRAVLGLDAPSVASASAAVGANVLVADPNAGTFFQLKQMVTEFCRSGARPCPEVFQARLA